MKIIHRNQVFALLPMETCLQVMQEALLKLHQNTSKQYDSQTIPLHEQNSFSVMLAYYDEKYFGAKVVSRFPGNSGSHYATHQGTVLLFDSRNGKLLACVDASAVTQLRTGAISALATHVLARPDASRLAFIGAGTQARAQLEALRLVRPISDVCVFDINKGYAESFAEQAHAKYGMKAETACDPAEAVRYADIICTQTYAAEPLLHRADIMPGAHINAIGACRPNTRELSTDLIAAARLFSDSRQALLRDSGDFLIPLEEKAIRPDHFLGDLSQLLYGGLPGRLSGTDITIFKGIGLAVEDIAAAKYIYGRL